MDFFDGEGECADILTPYDYHYQKLGKPNLHYCFHFWGAVNVRCILENPIYKGTLAQHRKSTISYKNKKVIRHDEGEWIVIKNNHDPIVSQYLWDKVQEIREYVSTDRCDKKGELTPLSGFFYCNSCGSKMRLRIAYKGARAAFPAENIHDMERTCVALIGLSVMLLRTSYLKIFAHLIE